MAEKIATNVKIPESEHLGLIDLYLGGSFHQAFHPTQAVGWENTDKSIPKRDMPKDGVETEIQYNSIPINIIKEYARVFSSSLSEKIIISIGSGNAQLEKYLINEKILADQTLICIDPQPLSYSKAPICIKPKYNYVKNLLEREPNLKEKLGIMIIWPLPNDSDYDMDSIKDLKPKVVLILAGPDGSSGSSKLLSWLKDLEQKKSSEVADYELIAKYESIRISQYNLYSLPDCTRPTLYLIRRKGFKINSIPKSGVRYTIKDAKEFATQIPPLESYLLTLEPKQRYLLSLKFLITNTLVMMKGKDSDSNENALFNF